MSPQPASIVMLATANVSDAPTLAAPRRQVTFNESIEAMACSVSLSDSAEYARRHHENTMSLQDTTSNAIVHRVGFTATTATYYDVLEPEGGATRPPMVLIHGGGHTGACYLATADGRPGWASVFARHGHQVIVPDWPGVGRSGHVPHEQLNGEVVVAGLAEVIGSLAEPAIVLTHSMSGAYGWKLLERCGDRIARVVGIAPSVPGNIQPAPVVVADDGAAIDVRLFEGAALMQLNRKAAFAPSAGFAEKKLVGDSRRFPREHMARYAASLIAIPPRLPLERLNVDGSQLKVADFSHYAGKRILVLTGTHDLDHPVDVDKPIVDWLNDHGAKADFVYLGDRGITGNGHMMMMESNSDQLADLIDDWLTHD
jgi:pimeloyl-ACP methyl ester carboxylesterase